MSAANFRNIAVIGADTMGSGIAYAFLNANIRVTILESDDAGMQRANTAIDTIISASLASGHINPQAATDRRNLLKVMMIQPDSDTGKWLNDDLANVDLLIEINLGKELNNAMKLVNDKRTEYQQVPRFYREDDFVDDNPYQFDLIKPHLDKLETYHKKKAYLLRIKTDYLQKRYDFDREDGVDFDEQIDLELDYLEAIKKLSQEANFSLASKLEPMVVIWELPQNVFIDFIYQI